MESVGAYYQWNDNLVEFGETVPWAEMLPIRSSLVYVKKKYKIKKSLVYVVIGNELIGQDTEIQLHIFVEIYK